MGQHFERLCKEAEQHKAKVLAERIPEPSPGHIIVRVQFLNELIEGEWSYKNPTSPEQQARAFLVAKDRGMWRWPEVEEEV